MGGKLSEPHQRHTSSSSTVYPTSNDNVYYCNIPNTLSAKEKQAIRHSWKIISPNIRDTGMMLFIRYFQRDPSNKDFFPAFRDLSVDQLTSCLVLRAHATTVMMTFMSLVDNLDNPDRFHQLLTSTAVNHHGRGVGMREYSDMFETLLVLLEDIIGEEFQGIMRSSWQHFATLALDVIGNAQDMHEENGNIS